ncbi:MAG: transporter [Elusimicrobia bacterium]|nr:transporter [Elusimicrobiota bacterium]
MKIRSLFAFALGATLFFSGAAVWSEEGGRGHTLAGDKASFAGVLPAQTAPTFRFKMMFYDGNVEKNTKSTLGASRWAELDRAVSSTQFELAYVKGEPGESWRYGVELCMPLVYESAAAYFGQTGVYDIAGYYYDYEGGLGDISFIPLMVGKQIGSNHFKTGVRLYAPTGYYREGSLAQGGLNYWTYSPFLGLSNVVPGKRELSLYTGYDIRERNTDTDYKSGDVLHMDAVAAIYTDMQTAIGITGSLYQQLTADKGSGAVFGSFQAQSYTVGPLIRHTAGNMSFEFKWLPEFSVMNRTEGSSFWLNFGMPF